jgi:hypothetical protein
MGQEPLVKELHLQAGVAVVLALTQVATMAVMELPLALQALQ